MENMLVVVVVVVVVLGLIGTVVGVALIRDRTIRDLQTRNGELVDQLLLTQRELGWKKEDLANAQALLGIEYWRRVEGLRWKAVALSRLRPRSRELPG